MSMQNTAVFETPENVTVAYRIAGPGTRYVAFIIDMLVLLIGGLLIGLMLLLGFLTLASTGSELLADVSGMVAAVVLLVGGGFALIGYFGIFEYFMAGQTPGKRVLRIRVVNEQGFALSATSILLRSVFRVIDVIPVLWLVPLLSAKIQRFGDMVAGTIVVSEEAPKLHAVREQLAARNPVDARFTFNPAQTSRLRPVDTEAVETFLERRENLHPEHRAGLSLKLCRGLSTRLETETPGEAERETYLEDLLAAYARREARELV